MDTTFQRYADLPIGDRAAFELVCARHGFAPAHFEITGSPDPDDIDHPLPDPVNRQKWQFRNIELARAWLAPKFPFVREPPQRLDAVVNRKRRAARLRPAEVFFGCSRRYA